MVIIAHDYKEAVTVSSYKIEIDIADPTERLERIINNASPLLEQMNQIIFIKNTHFQYVDCNKKLVVFSRLGDKKRIIDLEDYDLPWAEDTQYYRKIDQAVLGGHEEKILMAVRVASGEKITAIQNKKAIKDPHTGKAIGIVATMTEIQDITLHDFLSNIKAADSKNLPDFGKVPVNYSIQQPNKYNLTPREFECLFYVLRGMTYKMIADMLKISPRTVEKFICGIKYKMGCTYKTELIEKSMKDGLTDLIPPSVSMNGVNMYLKQGI